MSFLVWRLLVQSRAALIDFISVSSIFRRARQISIWFCYKEFELLPLCQRMFAMRVFSSALDTGNDVWAAEVQCKLCVPADLDISDRLRWFALWTCLFGIFEENFAMEYANASCNRLIFIWNSCVAHIKSTFLSQLRFIMCIAEQCCLWFRGSRGRGAVVVSKYS